MEGIFDSPLMTILVIVTIATILALVRTIKRDRCLLHFEDYHVTLAEQDGRVTWGEVDVQTSGLELHFPHARKSPRGFWKKSVLFYQDQYESMDGLYRSTVALPSDQKEDRLDYLEKTADPGFFRRLYRNIRNWVGMIRDAVVQSISLAAGAARKRGQKAATLLTRDEEQLSTLSEEIIGHTGNAYDPLLERHLFTRVIVDINRGGVSRQYCGYLADYTEKFLEIIDAEVNSVDQQFDDTPIAVGEERDGVAVRRQNDQLIVENDSGAMLLLELIQHDGHVRPVGAVIPDEFHASLRPGTDFDIDDIEVILSVAARIDILVPRAHAIVRHGVSGLNEDDLEDVPQTLFERYSRLRP